MTEEHPKEEEGNETAQSAGRFERKLKGADVFVPNIDDDTPQPQKVAASGGKPSFVPNFAADDEDTDEQPFVPNFDTEANPAITAASPEVPSTDYNPRVTPPPIPASERQSLPVLVPDASPPPLRFNPDASTQDVLSDTVKHSGPEQRVVRVFFPHSGDAEYDETADLPEAKSRQSAPPTPPSPDESDRSPQQREPAKTSETPAAPPAVTAAPDTKQFETSPKNSEVLAREAIHAAVQAGGLASLDRLATSSEPVIQPLAEQIKAMEDVEAEEEEESSAPTVESPAPTIDWATMDVEPLAEPAELLRPMEEDTDKNATVKKRFKPVYILVAAVALVFAALLVALSFFGWGLVTGNLPESIAEALALDLDTNTPSSGGVLLDPSPTFDATIEAMPAVPTATRIASLTPTPDTLESPVSITEGGLLHYGVDMVLISGAEFLMGAGDAGASRGHLVTLTAYYIDIYEITNHHYQECVESGACTPPAQNTDYSGEAYYGADAFAEYPVIYVNWEQAADYCNWRDARLPTEAEWEMAARWNPDSATVRTYPWGDIWDPTRLNYCDASCLLDNGDASYNDGWPQASAVGSFASGVSAIGVYDMAGNVSEWVADWYSADYYNITPIENPTGPTSGSERVVRGGAWGVSNADYFRSFVRTRFAPDVSGPGVGFRCAIDASEIDE